MLSVRLPPPLENQLAAYCAEHRVSKSHVVQEVLAEWLTAAKARNAANAEPAPEPDLSFLPADDPLRKVIGIMQGGPSTEEWMRITRGDDWNQP